MKKILLSFWLGFALLSTSAVFGKQDLALDRHECFIGPEWYHVKRTKQGGTIQNGSALGVHIGYDRLKRFGLYWGADAIYAYGTLNGKTSAGSTLRSHLTDVNVEGRFGFTFQQKSCVKIGITPYLGTGYFIEQNKFIEPSPIPAHFRTRYIYASAGFLSQLHLFEHWQLGLNVKAKMPIAPKCKVTNDPQSAAVDQRVGERMQYRVDLPLTYKFLCKGDTAISLVPFYEYRNYGGHPNFPFNFLRTRYNVWGANLQFQYRL
jgi:hypothetical protein